METKTRDLPLGYGGNYRIVSELFSCMDIGHRVSLSKHIEMNPVQNQNLLHNPSYEDTQDQFLRTLSSGLLE